MSEIKNFVLVVNTVETPGIFIKGYHSIDKKVETTRELNHAMLFSSATAALQFLTKIIVQGKLKFHDTSLFEVFLDYRRLGDMV